MHDEHLPPVKLDIIHGITDIYDLSLILKRKD